MGPLRAVIVLCFIGCSLAAPKPFDWDEFNRKFKEFRDNIHNKLNEAKEKLLPVAHDACGFVHQLEEQTQPPLVHNIPESSRFSSFPRYFPSYSYGQYPDSKHFFFNYHSRYPSQFPSQYPSQFPSQYPSKFPSQYPSQFPSQYPSQKPDQFPQFPQTPSQGNIPENEKNPINPDVNRTPGVNTQTSSMTTTTSPNPITDFHFADSGDSNGDSGSPGISNGNLGPSMGNSGEFGGDSENSNTNNQVPVGDSPNDIENDNSGENEAPKLSTPKPSAPSAFEQNDLNGEVDEDSIPPFIPPNDDDAQLEADNKVPKNQVELGRPEGYTRPRYGGRYGRSWH